MAAFSNEKHFDAVEYLANRPQYSQAYVDLIKAWHDKGTGKYDDALDVGCGPGQMTYRLAELFKNTIGADPSPVMLAAAQDPAVPAHLGVHVPAGHQLSFKQTNGESTGLPDGSFDLINAATSAHWLPWQKDRSGVAIWKEMARLLRPGGSLVFAGYVNVVLSGHELITDRMDEFIRSPEGWGLANDMSDELSPHMIGYTYYKTMPPPAEPYFDASQTTMLRLCTRFNAAFSITSIDVPPVPDWARSAGLSAGEQTPVVTKKGSLRSLALFLRSVSAWPRYVDEHPEEKELEKTCEDLPFRLVEKWRREEEEVTGKLLGLDEEVEFVYPTAMLFARKR